MPALCIVVRDGMLAAAIATKKISRLLKPQETQQIRAKRYHAGKTPYPAWYLFGCKNKGVEGLVACYTSQGADVHLCPESLLTPELPADILDVQFAALPEDLYNLFIQKNKIVFGYLPPEYASKTAQTDALKKFGGERFLPLQYSLGRYDTPLLPGEPEHWIVKTPIGAAGKGSNGRPYTVWSAGKLQKELPALLERLSGSEKIICSEFIITNDPYAGYADHVVHKMPFLSTYSKGAGPFGLCCQKLVHRCNWAALREKETLTLEEFIGTPEITTGCITGIDTFSEFIESLSFHRGRLMFSVDFIIPPDGIPRYLESNKLAATFADSFDPSLPPLLDFYAGLPLSPPLPGRTML